MSVVDEVRERTDIVELVGQHVQLRKSGRNFTGRCPFHEERTPSFVVSPDRGTWRCFGACGVGGDVFDFVMRIEKTDFRGALELLARRAGVALEPPTAAAAEKQALRDRYRTALDAAAALFHQQLLHGASAEAAQAYLARRAFDERAVVAFQLGWAADAWAVTTEALRARGFSDDELVASGLARMRDSGGVFDTFRGRLMFPIRDARGRVVGFGARTLDPEGVPKYLNSPQGDLFDKGRLLYGLDRAVPALRDTGRAVVVEGYTDVIRAHVAGFTNVVASLGTALTEHHVSLLKRYASTIVLALDADAAGQAATLRGLDVVRDAAEGEAVPVPLPSGAVRYQHRLNVEIRIAVLPAGKDPDDVVRDDPALWARLIDDAQPMMEYLFDVLTVDLDLADPRGKTTAADRLLPVIADIPDAVARAAWVARLSDRIHLDERALSARLLQADREQRDRSRRGDADARRRSGEAKPAASSAARDLSGWVLGHLLVEPKRLVLLADRLRAEDQAPLGGDDLTAQADRDLLEAIRNAARGVAPPDAPPEHRLDGLPADLHARASALRTRVQSEPGLDERTCVDSLREAVLRLREREIHRQLEELRHLIATTPADVRAPFDEQFRRATAALLGVQRLLRPDINRDAGKVDSALGWG